MKFLKDIFSYKYRFSLGLFALALCLGVTTYVFGNSSAPAAKSQQQSDRIVEVVEDVIESVGGKPDRAKVSHGVRKSAHFIEFAVLGITAALTVLAFRLKTSVAIVASTLYCIAVAVCDELSQTLSSGRSCEFVDMTIDAAGSILGILTALIVILTVKKRIKRKQSIQAGKIS